MKKRILSLLCVLMLCLGLLPVTALAAGNAPATLYVGETQITGSGYWITDANGKLTTGNENNYNVYYDGNGTLTLNNATIQGRGIISEGDPIDYGIYAASTSGQSVALTINLIGSNTVKGYCGIYVGASGGDSTLVIQSDTNGSLETSGSGWNGIALLSDSGNVFLTINNVSVEASTEKAGYYGVSVTSNAGSPTISLTVNGGSLTAQGASGLSGIRYIFQTNATNPSISLTVQNNAWIKAMPGIDTAPSMASKPTPQGDGIVFDGNSGTVYGSVTLQDDLTIDQDETLTIPEGSTLNTNGNLTNNGTIVNTGGTLNGEPGGIIVTAPAITTESLPDGTAGQSYTATLEATGNNITWSASDLPAGLTLDAGTGAITGTPATDGEFQVTITATNSVGRIDRTYTLNIKPATVSVTGLKLDKDSLTLQENGSDTLTATVEPADATNKDVTWASSDNNIATVSEDGTVTAINAGTATITATAADGSGISASCNLTVTHGNMIQTPKKDATCTVDGTEEYWTCEICGKHYKDESGTIPTTPEENKIPATGHNYGEPEWSWSEDGKTCTVTFTCANDKTHKETPEVKVTSAVKTPATCTEKGVTTYTAAVEFNGQTYTDTKDVADIPATNHSYGEPEWNWSEDGKTCTVTFTCANDETHKETPEVKVTSAVKTPATCTEKGVTTYTAVVEFNGKTYTDTKNLTDIPATGHSYGKPEWNWSEDGKTCTVTFTCANDKTHKETPEVKVASEVKTPATCTEAGVTTYTATVEFNGKTYANTKEVADIPATGHSYENGKCTVCGAIASDFKAVITAGANGTWQKGTKDGLSFTSNAAYKHFQKVQVDGKDLDASNYTVKEGSTIVTLKASYLETLSVGKHTLSIVSDTGTATTEFTVKAAASANNQKPLKATNITKGEATESVQTGDNTNMMLWIVLLIISASALGITAFGIRKKHTEK